MREFLADGSMPFAGDLEPDEASVRSLGRFTRPWGKVTSDVVRVLKDAVNDNECMPMSQAKAYVPGTAGDWAGTPPATISEAIDRLAAVVKVLNSGTGA